MTETFFDGDVGSLLEYAQTPDLIKERFQKAAGITGKGQNLDLNPQLPSSKEEFEKAEELTPMFDTTRRAGAGGTKAGLFGIRPSGGKGASAFLENYTGTGRFQKQKPLFSYKQKFEQKSKIPGQGPTSSVVIYTHCMDCMEPVNCFAEDPELIVNTTYVKPPEKEIAAAAGLKVGDQYSSPRCLKCQEDAVKTINAGQFKIIQVLPNGKPREVTNGQVWGEKRQVRIFIQTMAFIKMARDNPRYQDIFHGDIKKNAS